tara:strand:- start:31 stop:915 length:885 start_codon:yes stop_codon:yes gene_type:complete
MKISYKKILVTGATGYIGSHVCKKLKYEGHLVTGCDINIYGKHNDIYQYVDEFLFADITENKIHGEFDAVVHLAGRSIVPLSIKEPSEYYRVNTLGTLNLLQNISTDNFIFASSSSVFAMASPYARSKAGAEDIIKEKASGHTIFRFFNVSGTDGINKQIGPATHLIRVAALAASGKIDHIKIYGNDYDTRDGTCIRDYIHVEDVSDAIVNAIELGPSNTPYECLGSKKGFTVNEVIDTMEEVTGEKITRIVSPRRKGDSIVNIVDKLSNRVQINKSLKDMCYDQYKLERKFDA